MRRCWRRPSAPACRCCSWARSARRKCCRRTPIRCNSARPASRRPTTAAPRSTIVKAVAKGPVNVGYAAMAIPISRGEIDFAAAEAEKMGIQDGGQGSDPAADAGLHAVRDQDQGCRRQLGVLLGAMGDRGPHASRRCAVSAGTVDYLTIAHLEAEGELPRVKDPKFYVMGANAFYAGRAADPQGDRSGGESRRRQISGQPDDRRLARRARARSSACARPAGPRPRRRSQPRCPT